MGKYICGPAILRLPDRVSAIVPGDRFEFAYEPEHEAMALASGAITLQPGEKSLAELAAERLAAAEAEAAAHAAAAAKPAPASAAPAVTQTPPPAPASLALETSIHTASEPASAPAPAHVDAAKE